MKTLQEYAEVRIQVVEMAHRAYKDKQITLDQLLEAIRENSTQEQYEAKLEQLNKLEP